jgi:hypothetical protein
MAKRNGKFSWLNAALLFLAICCSAMAEDRAACPQQIVAGTYAVAIQGTVIMPGTDGSVVPAAMASLGVATIDLKGTTSINGYQSIGGQVSQTQMTGTITVNSDCTASADFGGGMTETLVIIGNGAEMRSLTLAGGRRSSAHSRRCLWRACTRSAKPE